MARYTYNNYYETSYQPRPSKQIYALRKEGHIQQARSLAESIIQQDRADDSVWQAYAWTLIDICKAHLESGEMRLAQEVANQLEEMSAERFEDQAPYDNFAEMLVNKIKSLSVSANPYASQIQEAKELSKNGNNQRAWEILSQISSDGNLPLAAHENYGWVIYKYLRECYNGMSSEKVRSLLKDYISLGNERPSALHSQILNFALNYSKEDTNFKLLSFIKLWGIENFQSTDFENVEGGAGKSIPSLMSRIARTVVDYSCDDIQEFIHSLNNEKFTSMLQEQYFWKMLRSVQGGASDETWILFDKYLALFADVPSSISHSKVLGLAERLMVENNAYRFYHFFQKWKPEKLRAEDWKEEKGENGANYKPLALKSLKSAKEAVSTLSEEQIGDIQWLIDLYAIAVSKFPNDEWAMRDKAMLHRQAGQLEEAKNIYKNLCLKMGSAYYIWQEFASCWEDRETKIALLCKAISLERDENFIGNIRLELAKQFIASGKCEAAAIELALYKENYTKNGWRISNKVTDLESQCADLNISGRDNKALYKEYIFKGEECAYADIPYTDVALVKMWKDESGNEYVAFTDGVSIEFKIKKRRFPALRNAHVGQVWRVKLYTEKTTRRAFSDFRLPIVKPTPLLVRPSEMEDWACLPKLFGHVQYINTGKSVYHIYLPDGSIAPVPFKEQSFQVGDLVSLRKYKKHVKEEVRTMFCDVKLCEEGEALRAFKSCVVVVGYLNDEKQSFHFESQAKRIRGSMRFSQAPFIPAVGDHVRIFYYVRTVNDKMRTGHKRDLIEVIKMESTDD
jgi:hypothetical protein